jgi:hypothetical protein
MLFEAFLVSFNTFDLKLRLVNGLAVLLKTTSIVRDVLDVSSTWLSSTKMHSSPNNFNRKL